MRRLPPRTAYDAPEPRASAAAREIEDGMAAGDDAMAREALRASGLFGAADEAAIDALVRVLRIRRFRRGETVFHQGDPGDALFVLASGSVKVVLPSDEGAEPAIVAILGPGEFFGELAILDGAPHSATIVAVEATETLVLHRDAFLDLIDADAAEIRRLTGHVEDLHFLDLPGRLASRIVRLAASAGATSGEARITWPYTQSELAGMIGGSRQSVNRLLADLTDQGLVRLERDHLVVVDIERLARSVER